MEVKIAFFRKKYDSKVFYVSKDIDDAIESMSLSKGMNSFVYDYKENILDVMYTVSKEKNGTKYLYLSCESSPFKSAKVLDEIKKRIKESDLRKNYYISILRDDPSQYFCEKLYVKFSIFERRLRELVFGILTLDLGSDWYDKTIQTDLDKDIKEILRSSNRSKLIQEAMHNMTLFHLESYLFDPYRKISCEEVVDKVLKKNEDFTTIEDIISYFESARAQSLWERFFDGRVEIKDLYSKLKEMRAYRNTVAHSKEMPYNTYIYCNKLLKDLVAGIDKAIESLDKSIYKKVSFVETFAVLSETISELVNNRLEGMYSSFEKLAEAFSKIEFPKFEFDAIDRLNESLRLPLMDIDKFIMNSDEESHEDIPDEDLSEDDSDLDEDS